METGRGRTEAAPYLLSPTQPDAPDASESVLSRATAMPPPPSGERVYFLGSGPPGGTGFVKSPGLKT